MTTATRSDPSPGIEPGSDPGIDVLGHDANGVRLPDTRERLLPPMPGTTPIGRLVGWAVPLLLAIVGGLLRFVHLGRPNAFVFDEVYYPKDAYAMLHHGVEFNYSTGADAQILAGTVDPTTLMTAPSFVVHPPLGKWVIALGELMFGLTPVGWRVMVALLGTASILLIGRLVRRLTRSDVLGGIAALLMAIDGLAIVMSRTGLLDLPLMFFSLAAVAALGVDRDWARARLAAAIDPATGRVPADSSGPGLWWRPWRVFAGLLFGCAVATKWNGAYILMAFALLSVAWDFGARRTAGVRRLFSAWFRWDAIPAFVSTVVVAVAVYLVSWTGWFATKVGWDREWGTDNPATGPAALVPNALRSLWHYHAEMLNFHTTLTVDHPYKASAWSWLVLGRPTAMYSQFPATTPCGAKECVASVIAIGTPLIWWTGVAALLVSIVMWIAARDWRFGVPVVGLAATWLPWLPFGKRPIFFFYAIETLPFTIIALALVAGMALGSDRADRRRRTIGVVIVAVFLVLAVLNAAEFYPLVTGLSIPREAWARLMWFDRWI